jgi:hypothetical protein
MWFIAAACAVAVGAADEESQPSKADKRAAQRLEIMRGAIDDFKFVLPDPESAPRFAARPLLRYNDQTRDGGGGVNRVLDATVWRLGEVGRPLAIVTLEIYLADRGSARLTYEFVSLTPQKFDMKRPGVHWMPHSTDLAMTEFDDAPVPADTPKARLVQMRELARRFTVAEQLGKQRTDLRLLSQPVDRYEDPAANILDGAVFFVRQRHEPRDGAVAGMFQRKMVLRNVPACRGEALGTARRPVGSATGQGTRLSRRRPVHGHATQHLLAGGRGRIAWLFFSVRAAKTQSLPIGLGEPWSRTDVGRFG